MHHKDKHRGVEFEGRALRPHAQRHVLEDPPVVQPVGHHAVDGQRGWDGCTLKVLALARGVLGEGRDGHVEPGEAREAAKDEEGEAECINEGAHAEGEGHHGRCDAK